MQESVTLACIAIVLRLTSTSLRLESHRDNLNSIKRGKHAQFAAHSFRTGKSNRVSGYDDAYSICSDQCASGEVKFTLSGGGGGGAAAAEAALRRLALNELCPDGQGGTGSRARKHAPLRPVHLTPKLRNLPYAVLPQSPAQSPRHSPHPHRVSFAVVSGLSTSSPRRGRWRRSSFRKWIFGRWIL